METRETEALGAPERVGLALAQLDDIASAVEAHGTSLGMLLESLMSLVERHQKETVAAPRAHGEGAAELTSDHETMLRFREPLNVVCQFHDRLRQRLEHVRASLAPLPSAPPSAAQVAGEVLELFPFDEERAVSAALSGAPLPPGEDAVPEMEIF